MARPMPRLPPVTSTLRIGARQLAGAGDVERLHESDHRRYLVWRKALPAICDDVIADRLCLRRVGTIGKHHVSDHDGAGDRALARAHPRHPHTLMAVDHRLDFLGVNLEAPDIDDSAAA